MQICDVLQGGGHMMSREHAAGPQLPVYFSISDFQYMGAHPFPRFGNGSFAFALRSVWEELAGAPLQCTVFGKPYRPTYDFAQLKLQQMATQRDEEHHTRLVDELEAVEAENKVGGWVSEFVGG